MAVSLYDLSIATHLQVLGGLEACLTKSLGHFADAKIDADAVLDDKLAPDMWPLRLQVHAAIHHSLGAVRGVQAGTFSPPGPTDHKHFTDVQKSVADAREVLERFTPEEINTFEGGEVVFQFRDLKLPFTAEGFLLSFSLPNFYFHATTAYDILRAKGVPLGKRDFMGRLRLKR
ncbi:MAG: DUF1993 domain-containing protein [Pseudomonadota bacterium]